MEKFNRINYAIRVASLFYLLGLLMSFKLWLPVRGFPKTPVFYVLKELLFVEYICFVLLLVALFLNILKPRKLFSIGIVLSTLWLVLFDQLRLQAWVYMYFVFFVVFVVFHLDEGHKRKNNSFLFLRIFIIGQYIWAGIHKFNTAFIEKIYFNMVGYFLGNDALTEFPVLMDIGYAIPFLEISIGLSLFLPKFRTYALVFATIMHCFILLYLSPFVSNWNSVVYPWNIAMIALNWLVFYKQEDAVFAVFSSRLRTKVFAVSFIVLVYCLPVLSFFGYWDQYLSFSLYSGKMDKMIVLMDKKVTNNLSETVQQYCVSEKKYDKININDWCYKELNIPIVAERRVFKKLAAKFCYYQKYGKVSIREYPWQKKGENYISFKCPTEN